MMLSSANAPAVDGDGGGTAAAATACACERHLGLFRPLDMMSLATWVPISHARKKTVPQGLIPLLFPDYRYGCAVSIFDT